MGGGSRPDPSRDADPSPLRAEEVRERGSHVLADGWGACSAEQELGMGKKCPQEFLHSWSPVYRGEHLQVEEHENLSYLRSRASPSGVRSEEDSHQQGPSSSCVSPAEQDSEAVMGRLQDLGGMVDESLREESTRRTCTPDAS